MFPLLPFELRRAIWQACLPQRIVHIHFEGSIRCFHTSLRDQRRFPVIVHVCREARQVAFETGNMSFPNENGRDMYWFDTARDTLKLGSWEVVHRPDLRIPDALGELERYVGKSQRFVETSMHSLNMQLCFESLKPGKVEFIVPVQSRGVSFIHITRQEAIEKGLFGLHGDSAVLIDALDLKKLQEYTLLSRSVEVFDDIAGAVWPIESDFLQIWIDNGEHRRRRMSDIAAWQDWMFLDYWWRRSPPDGVSFQEVCDSTNNTTRGTFKSDHPWVQETRTKIPRVRHVFFFHLCTLPSHHLTREQPPEELETL